MSKSIAIATYATLGLLVVIAGGFAGWYLYLHGKTTATQQADTARGFNSAVPSFTDTRGSTAVNGGFTESTTIGGSGTIAGNGSASLTGTTSAAASAISYSTPRLWQADKSPVSGFGFVNTGSGPHLYYVEQATGYVFSADPRTGALVRLTNTLRPKIQEAALNATGGVLERSIGSDGSIVTFSGTIATTSEDGAPVALAGKTLDANIEMLSANPTLGRIFWLRSTASGTSGMLAEWDGSKPKSVFTSPLAGWRPLLLSDGRLIVTQTAADDTLGYSFQINKDGSLSELAAAQGLTALPRALSTAILYGSSQGGALALFSKANAQATPVQLGIKTLADKCAWAPPAAGATADKPGPLTAYCAVPLSASGNFLTNWYQGTLHTVDAWWIVDASAGSTRLLYAPQSEGSSVDVVDPVVDPSGTFIAFLNGTDHSLWLLRVNK